MRNGLIWATAEDLTKNRGQSPITTQILQSLNSQKLPLTFAASLAKKAEVGAMFWNSRLALELEDYYSVDCIFKVNLAKPS
ncbi:hypothetical protein AHAS_Ahas19G0373400 [Arachis hypogaea]